MKNEWWENLSRPEQDAYIKRHPKTDLRPTKGVINDRTPDQDEKKKFVDDISSQIEEKKRVLNHGMPSAVNDFVEYANRSKNEHALSLIKKMKDHWDNLKSDPARDHKEKFNDWGRNIIQSSPDEFRNAYSSMVNDPSVSSRKGLKSLSDVIRPHLENKKSSAIIKSEFLLNLGTIFQ